YYKLLTQYLDIHWIFIVPRLLYPLAVEMLLRPESTLLSQVDPVDVVVNAIRAGSISAERISQSLLSPEPGDFDEEEDKS
ncbi:hypothetical protein, partial [Pseudomonas sp. Kh7]